MWALSFEALCAAIKIERSGNMRTGVDVLFFTEFSVLFTTHTVGDMKDGSSCTNPFSFNYLPA